MANSPNYQPHIDGLRAIAVLSVVFYHYGFELFGGGFVGVDVFFVISGYLISRLILNEINGSGDFSFKRFYIRRVRRLFPALAFTLVFSLLGAILLLSPPQLQSYGKSLAAAVLSVSNIQFWLESGYFDASSELKPLLHTWSLSVEEQFYLIWPALLWLCARRAVWYRQLAILVIGFALSFALNYYWVQGQFDAKLASSLFYLTPFRIFELALGGSAIFFARVIPKRQIVHESTMALGLLLIFYAVLRYDDTLVFPYLAALAPCVGALLVIVSGQSRYLGSALTSGPAVAVGLASYSLYLIHWPLLVFYKLYTYQPLRGEEYALLFLASAVLAGMMYLWIEKPFRKPVTANSGKGDHRNFLITSAVVMFSLAAIGVVIGQSDGQTWRNKHGFSTQQIENGSQRRYELIRQGCSVLRLDKPKYCKLEREHQLLVIGNSHEPDGFNIFHQIYGANRLVNLISFGTVNNCHINFIDGAPVSKVTHQACDERTAALSNELFLSRLSGVILSSNQPFDEKQTSGWEILHYLRKVNPSLPITVLGSYLNTERNCTDLHQRFGSFRACKQAAHLSYDPFNEYQESTMALSKSIDFLYLDKTKLACKKGTLPSCAIMAGSEPAFYDRHHLSRSFAQHLGKRIAATYSEGLAQEGFPAIAAPNSKQAAQERKQ